MREGGGGGSEELGKVELGAIREAVELDIVFAEDVAEGEEIDDE